jgi:hypothetical protein
MKYVLLALATLLAVFGCIATVANFSMVFEGTASNLIAGTVALGCGILVAGQVFILRAIESLQTALARRSEDFIAAAVRSEGFAAHPRQVELPVAPAALDLPPEPLADTLAPEPQAIESASHKPAPFDLAFAPRRDAAAELAQPSPIGSDMAHASEMLHPSEEAERSAPPIDTDLLLKAAMAAPLPVPPEPPVQPAEERPAAAKTFAFERAPETSPSLSELWRRVSAKTPKKGTPAAGEEPQVPPPPPIATQSAPVAPDWPGTLEPDRAHESDDRAQQQGTQAAPAFEFETSFQDVVPKSVHEPVASDWLDRALADLDLPAPPQMTETHAGADKPLDAAAEKSSAPPTATAEAEPASAAAGPSEMGRYQANGTTYIMFSDGSIEAQTETGVYRFGSMAELKTFFEEQAVVH